MSDQYEVWFGGKKLTTTGETCTDPAKVTNKTWKPPSWMIDTNQIEYIKRLNKMTKQEREEWFNGNFTKEVWCVEKESLDEFLNDTGGSDE